VLILIVTVVLPSLLLIANRAVRKISGIKLSVVYALLVVCIAADYAFVLGVAFGGLTENMCLLVGTKGLSLVALLLYALSLLSLILAERVRGRAKAPD
jgi:hypothetical protein